MKYTKENLAVVIPSNNKKNVIKCIDAIKKQTKSPGQTIVVFDKKIKFKNKKNFIFSYTNISNQVHQRNYALKFLNKKIKLILQLDDKFCLNKNAIENLIFEWNNAKPDIAGIGLKSNSFQYREYELNFLKYITLTGSSIPGKVLISGFNTKLVSQNNLKDVDWLQGGLSSWRLKHVQNIFDRKFPIIKWSIFEDLIFSFNIKKNKKFRLIMSNIVKAYTINKKNKKFTPNDYLYRGFEYGRMHKVFVYINSNSLSKIAFFYSYISSSILGILWCIISLDSKLLFYLGRFKGIFANIKKIKVL